MTYDILCLEQRERYRERYLIARPQIMSTSTSISREMTPVKVRRPVDKAPCE